MQVSANSGILIIKGSLVPGTWPHQVTCCHYIVCIGITNRVNSAIDTLRRVRAGMIAERKRDAISSMRSDLASAFGRKRGAGSKPAITSKKAKRAAWKHEFVCLAYCQQKKVPTTECERDELFEAKLGKKEIEFSTLEMDANAFREVLYEAYPKLRDGGGFQLCRCIPNSWELEPLSRHVLSSPRLLKERVGQARTYIVPLQRDLDVTPSVDIPEEVRDEMLIYIFLCVT